MYYIGPENAERVIAYLNAFAEPKPIAFAAPKPVAFAEPEPFAFAEPKPIAFAEPKPVAFVTATTPTPRRAAAF